MTLPNIFGPQIGPIPTNQLDQNFTAVGAMGILQCTAAGTGNTITLTAAANQVFPTALYTGFTVQWVANATNSSVTNITVGPFGGGTSFGPTIVYKDTAGGPVILAGGEIVAGCHCVAFYDAAINAGAGGYHLLTGQGTGGGGGSGTSGAWQFLGSVTSSTAAALQLTTLITTTNDKFVLVAQGIQPSVAGAYPLIQFSTTNGSTYDTTSIYSYANWYVDTTLQTAVGSSTADSGIAIGGPLSTGASHSYNGTVTLYDLSSASLYKKATVFAVANESGGTLQSLEGVGQYANTSTVNALQVTMSTGTITGSLFLYAIANTNGSGGGGSGSTGASAIIGSGRNIKCQRLGNTTLSISATEAVVKVAPGGAGFLGNNIAVTLNLGIVGVNGRDGGSLTANTFYGWYFICNPTTGVFASLASTSFTTPTLPSGYTAYALMGVIPVDASSHVIAGFNQYDRTCTFQRVNIFSGTVGSTTLTSQSIAAAVPSNALTATGVIGASTTHGIIFAVASDGNGSGMQVGGVAVNALISLQGYGSALPFNALQLTTPQVLFWADGDTGSDPVRLDIMGYSI